MTAGVTIGEFSRLCHLSAKTLRYYHDIELLVPAGVDEATGYRRYAPDQVDDAHLIRRLRDLDMPLAEIRRRARRAGHGRTAGRPGPAPGPDGGRAHPYPGRRGIAATAAGARSRSCRCGTAGAGVTGAADVGAAGPHRRWRTGAGGSTPSCTRSSAPSAPTRPVPAGATYSAEFFEGETGDVVAFVPVAASAVPAGDDRFGAPARPLRHRGPQWTIRRLRHHLRAARPARRRARHRAARPDRRALPRRTRRHRRPGTSSGPRSAGPSNPGARA